MDLSKPLIINAELFLQCHGSCVGCFLTAEERLEENTYLSQIKEPIISLLKKNTDYSSLILGFGRGNLLNLPNETLLKLLDFMKECEDYVGQDRIIYEVSTSLIGKIDKQIEKALFLIEQNKNIFFNVVINSEITSTNFWNNWEKLYKATSEKRKSWGWTDNYGDILVLNINPKLLPNLDFIENFFKDKGSPINISLFPFSESTVTNQELLNLKSWSEELWKRFHKKDLNIKNYLKLLQAINIDNDINDIINYHNNNMESYYFIGKDGEILEGSLSIMGEVDYFRLKNKFSINPEIKEAFKVMQKTKPCNVCSYQKECLLSGAYLNMMNNYKKIKESEYCLSGYQSVFDLSQSAKDS